MPDLITDSPNAPDVSEIERGNSIATADAISTLHLTLQQEIQHRRAADTRLDPEETMSNWVNFIGGGF